MSPHRGVATSGCQDSSSCTSEQLSGCIQEKTVEDEYEPNHPNNQSKKQVPLGRTCVSFQAYNVFLKPKAAKVYGHIVELTDLGRTQNKLSYYRSFH